MPQTLNQSSSRWQLGLDPLIVFSLLGAIVFFIVSGFFAYLNLTSLQENTSKIVRSHDVIVALDELLSSTQDAETGQRGYLLTNNVRYLDPYEVAVNAIPRKLEEIAELVGANPAQSRRLALLGQHVNSKLGELRETINLQQTQGTAAALAVVNSDRGKVAMDSIRGQLLAMSREETALRVERIGEMNKSYRTALVSSVLAGVLGILLTIIVGAIIRHATISRRHDEWLQSGNLELASALMGDQNRGQLGDSVLVNLARYTNAIVGAIYVRQGETFERVSTYGVPADAQVLERFDLKEGLLGQVAQEGKPLVVSDVPDNYIAFGSALGRAKPRNLTIVPGIVDGQVNTVFELGFIGPVEKRVSELLEQVSSAVAVAMRSAEYRSELQILVRETQQQSEELQVQSEELRVSNEELEEQSRALKETHTRLEQQQAELEQTNSQLEEQSRQLEIQKEDLERVNSSVQLKARELEQASRYKSDFLANMSHELRTPLNSSLILAKLLADNPDDNLTDEQVKFAQTIQSSGNDLLNLINDILDLSKIEAGHVDINPETVSVERLSKNLRQVFEPIAMSKNVAFEIEAAADSHTVIETDLQRLEQVLKNLLSNAFKFTERGVVRLSLRRISSSQIAISVSDTGIGIADEQQKQIFEAFHQADGTISRKYGGTGLGLSISRELVRLLGGSLKLESKKDQGSTFTVILPISYDPSNVKLRDPIPQSVQPAVPTASVNTQAISPKLAGIVEDDRALPSDERRILLVVEDDVSFAAILRDVARDAGFRTLVAGSAEQALTLAQEFMPNAIVLDVGLPDQSGLSVLDRLKRDVRTRHIPIHIVSADDHTETALSLGAIGYALKPVQRDELVEVIQKLETKLSQGARRVLIVEDNEVQRDAVAKLLSSDDVETVSVGTAAECLAILNSQTFDCMILDLSLPDASGFALLETLSQDGTHSFPPVIVYTGRVLSSDEELKLSRYSKSIIIKGAKSPERLLDEVSLFLHQVVSDLPAEQQKMIRKAQHRDAILEGRRILVVEDDIRNVYALTNILEPRGAVIQIARNGQEALDALVAAQGNLDTKIDLVLMDVMMPVMDGLTATREIRKNSEWRKLPIITLTAKAMPDDQKKCVDAGANDYMAKPLDVEKLLSLVRVWMPR